MSDDTACFLNCLAIHSKSWFGHLAPAGSRPERGAGRQSPFKREHIIDKVTPIKRRLLRATALAMT
jgi:hypothetical protein